MRAPLAVVDDERRQGVEASLLGVVASDASTLGEERGVDASDAAAPLRAELVAA
jgi:hypothetical protein